MSPTIGRVVIYNTTEADRTQMVNSHQNKASKLPAIIVAVWSENCINVKVLVDGQGLDLWKTSINEGVLEGMWSWPVITPVAKDA